MITCSVVIYKQDVKSIVKLADKIMSSSTIDFLYLIDNGMEDNSNGYSINSKVRYIFNGRNLGYGAGHNIAIKMAMAENSDYHIIINPDIDLTGNAIEGLYEFAELNPSGGLFMPQIRYPSGDIQYLCKLFPTPFDLIFRRFLPIRRLVEKRNLTYELRFADYNSMMEVPSLSGCFMFIRMSVLKKVGGFDERYFMYLEDLDLCRRIGTGADNLLPR